MSANPFSSSAERIAPTRPSIMSLGATMSAPARACDTASRASSSSVASLSTSPSSNDAAVPVIRVLAQADVGDHDELGHVALERAHRLLHRRLVVPRFGPSRVLVIGNPEQQHAADPRRRGRDRASTQHLVDRGLDDARHRLDRLADSGAGPDEQRQHELRRPERRLAHERRSASVRRRRRGR